MRKGDSSSCNLTWTSSAASMKSFGKALLVSAAVLLLCSAPTTAQRGNVEVASPPPSTTPTSAPTANGTALLPPTALTPEPSSKESIQDKWKHLEEGKSPAEKGIAITIGVIMLVGILTCLVCCVFRRGGQWRVPGLQWFKKKFGRKERYSRYVENQDDGF